MSAPQYCNRANILHNNQKFGHSLRPQLVFFFPQEGHGRRKILMDSHPYSHETSIFTMGKLVKPSPGISIIQDAHIVLSNRS